MFKAWPKIPRLENEIYHITEKIDGTNACIIIKKYSNYDEGTWADIHTIYQNEDYRVWVQSRTRLITPEEDHYGFAKWVQDNAEQLIKDLGVGYHFGEWWGKGINRGYGLEERRFNLFNPTKYSSICGNVPMLGQSTQQDLSSVIRVFENKLLSNGSYAAPGYMKPEGLVVYAEKAKTYWKVIIDK